MPSRSFQISGKPTFFENISPVLAQAESTFASQISRSRTESLGRQGVDYETGALSFAAYTKALQEDLNTINPDNPAYNGIYATLLRVRDAKEKLEDQDIVDKFERGLVSFEDVEQYFAERLRETAAETPEFFGLTGQQRANYLTHLDRRIQSLTSKWENGQIGINDYVEGLQGIRSEGGFVEDSPVFQAIGNEINSSKLQAELNELAESFELSQGEDLFGYIDKLDEIKNRFHGGSPIRAQVQTGIADVMSRAYTGFVSQENSEITRLFNTITSRSKVFSELGDSANAFNAGQALFGFAEQQGNRQPLTLKEFAENRPTLSRRLQPFRDIFGNVPDPGVKDLTFEEVQEKQNRSSLSSLNDEISASLQPFLG